MSIPYILKILKNTSAAGQCLLEAFDIIWNQLRCTESNLEHLTQIEQPLKQTINTPNWRRIFHFRYLGRVLITTVASMDEILTTSYIYRALISISLSWKVASS